MPLIPTKVADEINELHNTKWQSAEGWLNLTVRSTAMKQGLWSWSFKEPCASSAMVCAKENSYRQSWFKR